MQFVMDLVVLLCVFLVCGSLILPFGSCIALLADLFYLVFLFGK